MGKTHVNRSPLRAGISTTWVVLALLGFRHAGAEDAVKIVTAPPATEVKLTTEQATFVHDVVVEAAQAVKGLHVETTELVGPARLTLECKVGAQPCSQPFDIDANGSKTIRLSATLEAAGVYSAVVSVAGPTSRQSFVLQVTRNARAFPVELAASMAGASTRNGGATLNISLQEKRGSQAHLNPPTLALLLRAPGKTTFEETSFNAAFKLGNSALPAIWKLDKRAAPVLTLDVSGLAEAGEYQGRLRLTSPDSDQALDVPIVVMSGMPAWQAALLIAAGAVLSFLLRAYLKTVRPRLLQQRSAAVLATDLERLRNELNGRFAPLQSVEVGVVAALSDRLSMVAEQIDLGAAGRPQVVLDDVDAKLSLVRRWVNARRRAAALAAPPADVRKALAQVGEQLARPVAADAAALDTELKRAEEKIDTVAADEAKKRSDALDAAITASAHLDAVVKVRLQQALQAAVATLDEPEQRQQLDAIESELVDAQIAGLAQRIRDTQEPPLGFDAGSWGTLSKEVLAQLDAATKHKGREERAAAFRSAVLAYLRGLHAGLADRVATQLRAIEAASIPETDKTAYNARVTGAGDMLVNAAASLKAGKLEDAATALAQAGEEAVALQKTLNAAGLLGGPNDTPATAPVPAGLDLEAAALTLLSGLGPRSRRLAALTPSGWTTLIDKLDLLVLVVALVVSILLGLKLLWIDNATWGSVNDWVIALLWGLGLHQISNSAFEGIGGVMDKFAK